MLHPSPESRRQRGEAIMPFSVETLAHGLLRVPSAGIVHLQFRRFTGCPICNLHLKSFARRVDELGAAGVLTVAFFHSSAKAMRPYQGELPFPAVADPERHWYRRFGVERSPLAMFHPRAMWSGLNGLVRAASAPLGGIGAHDGLPADFLVSPSGALLDVNYGTHAADHWEVSDVLERAGAHREKSETRTWER